ncbi:MAG TPA: coniferyl aldehyde dehydrogenase [Labilithrix sp.]|nr:coniferyl aldehyde dehydrogenase [Labilithrix sp.]
MTLAENIAPSSAAAVSSAPGGDLRGILARMRAAARKSGPPDYDIRIEHLDKLERAVLERKHELAKAVSMDFGNRSKHETLAVEVMLLVNEIKHVRTHLHEWMETEAREVSWMFLPGRAEVVMQPVGVVGIVAPWNYPVQLSLAPLVNALAAGNRVMIKPSELASDVAEALKSLIAETFAPDHVTVVTGGPDVAESFTRLPFDHLVFTGSTRLGKIVMKAAAENLVPVTLELGGKSPAIIGEGYSLKQAAQKIMFGKCINAGQTCLAPDYVLLPKGRVDAFVEECRLAVTQMYPRLADNPDYTAVVSEGHYARLQGYLKDARDRGAKIVELNPAKEQLDPESRRMAPTIVLHPKDEMVVMQEEIFGPILPISTYETLDEALAYVNDHPRPLGLYYFDNNQRRIDRVLRETVSGGVTINDVCLHFAQSDLPFGGSGHSGMGSYHGREGFETFTKKKPVFYQSRISGMPMLRPPFGGRIDWMLKTLLGK